MKIGPRRTSWLAMAALAAVLVSILAVLYVRTRGADASSYFEHVALLRQLKQLDARWELDVMKSRMGVSTNYDALVDPLSELNQLRAELRALAAGRPHASAGALASGVDALDRAVQDKTRLIEQFKSHNAVLRNSLAFLPTAASDIQRSIDRTQGAWPGGLEAVSTRVNNLLLDSMVFSHAASADRAVDIRADLNRLSAHQASLPAAVGDGLQIFALHVGTVLREQPVVGKLLADVSAVPTASRIDDLDNLLSGEQKDAALRAQHDRQYLLAFAAALAALLLYAAVSLIRSHAVIQRVNKELLASNATLEERVRERTRELQAVQSELVTAARHAGMAEIANNVLHNVGNVLNSVNVSAGLVSSRVRDSKVQGLAKAVQLLNEHSTDLAEFLTRDEKGKLLPAYLNSLAATLAAERRSIAEEIAAMTRSVDHIKDIVAAQQAYAGASSVVEAVQITDVLEDALRMNADALARHQVAVIKEFADVPVLLLDKPRLLQVLVNLIRNAKQAMAGALGPSRRMTLGVELAEDAGGRRLCIRVADEGEGIAAENLTRIFRHGFTTRKDGHGFGLHSCVLAAKEMGGTLSARSDGPGLGATFTLELPARRPEAIR